MIRTHCPTNLFYKNGNMNLAEDTMIQIQLTSICGTHVIPSPTNAALHSQPPGTQLASDEHWEHSSGEDVVASRSSQMMQNVEEKHSGDYGSIVNILVTNVIAAVKIVLFGIYSINCVIVNHFQSAAK